MCYLCLQQNPFKIEDPNTRKLSSKKERAAEVKILLKEYEGYKACQDGALEIDKLKEEQYQLSRDI